MSATLKEGKLAILKKKVLLQDHL